MSALAFNQNSLIKEHCRVDLLDIGVMHRGAQADYCAMAQVFGERQYDIPGVFHERAFHCHQRMLSRGATPLVVDAGANIGAGSLWFTHKWDPCHIVAVEPDPINFLVLSANAQGRSMEIVQAGIDWCDGEAVLVDPGRGELGYQTAQSGFGIPVRMICLRTILFDRKEEPFILKVDIEGAEASLFSRDTEPAALFPIVILEPHDWMLPGQRSSVPFYQWHARHERELVFGGENVFSIDWRRINE